jgi:preprotein translocase subunit SecD
MHAEVLEADDRAVLDLLRKRLVLPGGVEALLERREKLDGDAARPIWRLELVKRGAEVTGDMVDDATASTDKMSMRPVVNLVFSEQGGRRFADLSERLIGKKLAIVVDGQVMSAPVVESRIAGGRAMITLGGTKPPEQQIKEAQDLAAALRGGALPAPMSLASERRIAPSK